MTGRPTAVEATRRRDELVELLRQGTTPLEAARRAGITAERVLRLIDGDAEVFELLRADHAEPLAASTR